MANDETSLGVPDRVLVIDQDSFGSGAKYAAHRFLPNILSWSADLRALSQVFIKFDLSVWLG